MKRVVVLVSLALVGILPSIALAVEPNPPVRVDCSKKEDVCKGTRSHDRIFGTPKRDRIVTYGGFQDRVRGGQGDDTILGQGGMGIVRGDGGNDKILGGVFSDTLGGGGKHDHIYGGLGIDSISGAAGRDTVYGYGDHDYLYCGSGEDRAFKGKGDYVDETCEHVELGPPSAD